MSQVEVEVEVGDQVFAQEGGDPVGAVRRVHRETLGIFIEGTGDVTVPASAVAAVHDRKVVLDVEALAPDLRRAIAGAHQTERPGL